MRTGAYSWKVKKGDTWVETFHLVDENETNVNIEDWVFAAKVKDNAGTTIATFTATVDEANSKVTFTVAKETTVDVSPGNYVWDAQWTETTGRRFTFLEGKFTVEKDIT